MFLQNTIETIAHPQTKEEDGHLISANHSQEMSASQCSGKAGIQFTGIPNFSLFISAAWLDSPSNKATHDPCDLHNHTSPEQPSRKKSGPGILEIRKSCLSGHGNWHWSRQWSIGNFNNPPGIWPSHVPGEGGVSVCGDSNFYFKLRYCGLTKPSGLLNLEIFESMRFAIFACYSVWYLYVMLCTFAVFVPCLCPLTG